MMRPGPGADAGTNPSRDGAIAIRGRRRWVSLLVAGCVLAAAGYVIWLRSDTPGLPAAGDQASTDSAAYVRSIDGVARPLGVAVASDGKIYVTEGAGERNTRVFDQQGNQLLSLAPPNAEAGASVPVYVAIGPAQEAYVSDLGANAIHVFAPGGAYIRDVAPPPSETDGTWYPLGLAFAVDGSLFVTEVTPGKHRVMVFDPAGDLRLTFGKEGKGDGEFSFPNAVVVDRRGRIYVSDSNNGRVQVFDAAGKLAYKIEGRGDAGVGLPRGLATDGRDRLYVADTLSGLIRVYNVSGAPVLVYSFGDAAATDGAARYPNGLALDAGGRLYVADRENNRVQVWQTR
mgnify:CR=1 FL=1